MGRGVAAARKTVWAEIALGARIPGLPDRIGRAAVERVAQPCGQPVELVDGGNWISGGNRVDPRRLPADFLDTVRHGQAAHQRTMLDGVPVLAVGLPLPDLSATYVEVSPLRELDRTFRFLSWILVAGTLASALAGALLGRWATTHALRPLRRVTAAAADAARGDLAVRLPVTGDPDLVSLAAAFNDTAERLQQRVARDTRFAGDVSHELRSPLTTMLNAMAVSHRRRAELPPGPRQAVELLDTDLRRFRRMVDDLLDISRYDQDRSTFELVDVAELVLAIARNLLDNATHHGRGLVRLGLTRHDGLARIEVDDDGPGVPESAREHIFERFMRRLVVACVLVLSACGVSSQDKPQYIEESTQPPPTATPSFDTETSPTSSSSPSPTP